MTRGNATLSAISGASTRSQAFALLAFARLWRSANSPGLTVAADDNPAAADSVPELLLHNFFKSLETPYRAYEAGDSAAPMGERSAVIARRATSTLLLV